MIWVVIALSDRVTSWGNGAPQLVKHSQKIFYEIQNKHSLS